MEKCVTVMVLNLTHTLKLNCVYVCVQCAHECRNGCSDCLLEPLSHHIQQKLTCVLVAGAGVGTVTTVGVRTVCTTGAVAMAPEEVITGAGATTWVVLGSTKVWVAGAWVAGTGAVAVAP